MRVPTGRLEQRIAKTEAVMLLYLDQSPIAKVEAFTENVSPRGARVITDSVCATGQLVCLDALEERLKLAARGFTVNVWTKENLLLAFSLTFALRSGSGSSHRSSGVIRGCG